MHHPTDRITHTTTFVTPVVEHWLRIGEADNKTKITEKVYAHYMTLCLSLTDRQTDRQTDSPSGCVDDPGRPDLQEANQTL